MSNKIFTLSGAATDVIYALFYRGAMLSGDLPSKSGTAELRDLGFAETRHTATEYQKENHFTFLTAEGQKFAVEHLVNTRFGKERQQEYHCSINLEVDVSNVQKMIDEFNERLSNVAGFKFDGSGKLLINGASIGGEIYAEKPEANQPVTNIYNINFGVRNDKPVQNKVTFSADKFEIKSGIDASSAVAAMDDLEKAIRKAIHNECLVGGIIQRRFSR